MYKNQLQELAQRSCVGLPAYTCIREGPDHAPRFKATVSFNGEIFESPSYCTTLRQAEHAAAEHALNTLSRRGGPSQSLAAKILDETSVCKNLLQETAQRAGLSLPIYTTLRAGPGHLPVFKCIVEVAGRVFAGEPAKTKKQAEKNAAMVAWSAIKQLREPLMSTESKEDDRNRGAHSSALTLYRGGGDRAQRAPHAASRNNGGRSRVRVVNVRERNWRSREGSPAGLYYCSPSQLADANLENGRSFDSKSSGESLRPAVMQPRNLPFFNTMDSKRMLLQDSSGTSDAVPSHQSFQMQMQMQLQHHPPRLSLQSHSDRYELRRSLVEEIQKEGDDEWLSAAADSAAAHMQQQSTRMGSGPHDKRVPFQSQSERFELKPSLLDELYHRDEEDWWLRGEVTRPMAMLERARSSSSSSMYWDREMDTSCMYYDGNRGLAPGVAYNNSDCITAYGGGSNAYKDANSIVYSVCGEDFGGGSNGSYVSPYTGLCDGLKLPSSSSYAALSAAPDRSSHGSSTYASYAGDASKVSFYRSEDARKAFGGGFPIISHSNEGPSSSTDIWSPAPRSPMCSVPAGSMSFGMRPASSLAPPVRVRHMVAVCSAPSQRADHALTSPMANNDASVLNRLHDASETPPPLSAEASTCQLFSHLRF